MNNSLITFENGLSFELNNNSFTAKLSISTKARGDLLIPQFINHESHKYFVTCIKEESFRDNQTIKSITFPLNSVLKSIEKRAFSNSSIESIYSIPKSCENLDESCFIDAQKLTQISISPDNPYYSYTDDEQRLLVHKIKENYNVLYFAFSDVEKAVIPSSINEIGSFAFYKCNNLKIIEFFNCFNLKRINKCAFLSSSIERIVIPKSVINIDDYSFSDCEFLRSVEFDDDDNCDLNRIGQCAFSKSSIENFCVPKKVKKICECAFSMCSSLKCVEFLGTELLCDKFCFYLCGSLFLVSFPNLKKVPIQINAHDKVSSNFSLFVCSDSNLSV